MNGLKSQAKLTRSHSSPLRSSPTVRSAIHSFSSVSEITSDNEDLEEQKPHRPCSVTVKPSTSSLGPVVALALLLSYTLFIFCRGEEVPASEYLLLALIFVAVLLFFAGRNKGFIHRSFTAFKRLCDDCAKRVGLSRGNPKPVEWFIGETNQQNQKRKDYQLTREGVEFYNNGDFYEGEFHLGRSNGSGVYNYFVNGRYEGDWVDGRYDGYGIESWAKGSRYRGQYKQGLRHGYGLYTFYTEDTYAGEWFNGQSHGVGMQICSDGSCFIGEFKYGFKHGLGYYHFRNGDRYAGEYFGDKIHGFGVYHFANDHCYEGSWHEGRRQGYGMYTFRHGETRSGEWDCGNLKIPHLSLTDAVIRAVQAARKASERAILLRRVDDQVEETVKAANRAATAARVTAIKAGENSIGSKI